MTKAPIHERLALLPPPTDLPQLGKLKRGRDKHDLKMRTFLKPKVVGPTIPKSRRWDTAVGEGNYGMLLNNQLGDCDEAMLLHTEQTWTANANGMIVPVDEDALTCYEDIAGYVPGDPSTDQGTVERTSFKYWRKTGIPVDGTLHKIAAFGAVNLKDEDEIKACIELLGAVEFGFALPISVQGKTEWQKPRGDGPSTQPGSWGGHAVPGVGYDRYGVYVVTWGEVYRCTWSFLAEYADEAWGVVSPDFISATRGTTPDGLDLAAMEQAALDLAA